MYAFADALNIFVQMYHLHYGLPLSAGTHRKLAEMTTRELNSLITELEEDMAK